MDMQRSSATLEFAVPRPALALIALRVTGADGAGEVRFVAPGESLSFGSAARCDVRLADAAVSARHCGVRHAGDHVEVVDFGSKNGVLVGGVAVGSARLGVGVCFEIGRSRVEIEEVAGMVAPGGDRIRVEPLPGLVGRSAAMRNLASSVRKAAPLRLPALVRGESGSGKELVARALHDLGRAPQMPFVVLNAATLSRELAESELFGHVRGAFTGAARERKGAFREAHGGTLFLDEIGALSFDVQAKLLRVVEDGVVRPLGSERGAPVDVRLVVATCEPLEGMVEQGRFRADLYERLGALRVMVPPLRERRSDIPELVTHLLAASELGPRRVSTAAMAVIRSLPYPGNVRELRNLVVQAALRASDVIEIGHVTSVLAERAPAPKRRLLPLEARRVLEIAEGNISRAARLASVPRSTMRDLLRAAGGVAAPPAPVDGDQKLPTTPTP